MIYLYAIQIVLCTDKMELLNYIPPKDRLSKLRSAYERLKSKIPNGNAQQEIESDFKKLGRVPKSLIAGSSEFAKIYEKLKIKFIRIDDPNSD